MANDKVLNPSISLPVGNPLNMQGQQVFNVAQPTDNDDVVTLRYFNANNTGGGNGGLTSVTTDDTLTGNGTTGSPLSVVATPDNNTTYTFTDGTDGSFTVTSSDVNVDPQIVLTGGSGGDDARPLIEQAQTRVKFGFIASPTNKVRDAQGLLMTEELTLADGTRITHYVDRLEETGRPAVLTREYWEGPYIDSIITLARAADNTIPMNANALIHDVGRPDTDPPLALNETWSFGFVMEIMRALQLTLSSNGLLTRTEGTTAEASLTENGLLTVPGGEYTLTENGLLQEMA